MANLERKDSSALNEDRIIDDQHGLLDRLLDEAARALRIKRGFKAFQGGAFIPVGDIGEGAELILLNSSYQRRHTGLPGRPLAGGSRTTQPVIALVEGGGGNRTRVITAFPYAEDVLALPAPLGQQVIHCLEGLTER